jgi:capsular polysaccharide biosynthesis protein
VTLSRITRGEPRARAWADDDSLVTGESQITPSGRLASLSFLGAALRRRAWLWCPMAVAGLLAALVFKQMFPPAYEASTSILMVYTPDQDPAEAVLTDIALAQSRTVAVDAMRKLGLPQSPHSVRSFQATYSVAQLTDRVIDITVSAPSSSEAVTRARALAAEFLQFRARELQNQQQFAIPTLKQQITQANQAIAALTGKIARISQAAASSGRRTPSAHPASRGGPTPAAGPRARAQQAELAALRRQRNQEEATLAGLEQGVQGYPVGTASEIRGTEVLDAAAPIHSSQLRLTLLYAWAGLVAGLLLGVGIVIVQALVSGRLRRRDDIARALGAPIHLSVGRLRAARSLPGRGSGDRDVQRLVAHLRTAVPPGGGHAAALAVVAVDNAKEVAPSLVALAVSYAQQGKQVVLADLAGGAPAAGLLGMRQPGTGTVRANGAPLVVTVPARDSIAPAGPLQPGQPGTPREWPPAVYDPAGLLLSLVTLDPSLGADHLSTWADSAAVVVTAGRSSGIRIRAVGEMIRLAGTPLVTTVLSGADKTDESLGATAPPYQRAAARAGVGR